MLQYCSTKQSFREIHLPRAKNKTKQIHTHTHTYPLSDTNAITAKHQRETIEQNSVTQNKGRVTRELLKPTTGDEIDMIDRIKSGKS